MVRERKFFKTLFDLYRREQGYQNNQFISTEYLLVSRKFAILPSLKKLEEENFDIVFKQYGTNWSICSFLDILNFTYNEIMRINGQIPDVDFNESIEILPASESFMSLLSLPLFQTIYENKRHAQKSYLLQYLDQMHIGNNICLVDIGWKGTMQNCIYQLYQEQRNIITESIYIQRKIITKSLG